MKENIISIGNTIIAGNKNTGLASVKAADMIDTKAPMKNNIIIELFKIDIELLVDDTASLPVGVALVNA